MRRRLIGLISDFGEGPYAGIMRAVIKGIDEDLEIVDIDHSVPSFSVTAGAYVLAHSYYWLPRGSVLVAVVDPGVGSARHALAVETANYTFIGPDNGILYPAAARDGIKAVYRLDESKVIARAKIKFSGSLPGEKWVLSRTFHGRDVFAPAAALIASESASPEELGERLPAEAIVKASIDHAERVNGAIRAQVVYIDKFGNLALSIRPEKLAGGIDRYKRYMLDTPTGLHQVRRVSTFSEANPGEIVIYVNSFGHMEIAINRGNAARRLGLEIDMKVSLIPREEHEQGFQGPGARLHGTTRELFSALS